MFLPYRIQERMFLGIKKLFFYKIGNYFHLQLYNLQYL